MKEKLRNLFDEMKVRSRYKSMNAIIDMIEPLINQEVEKRIKERMPSEEEIKKEADLLYSKEIFIVACDWLCSRLTNQKKEDNNGSAN